VAGMKEEAGNGQNGPAYEQTFRYYFQDELGSPIRLTDEEGNLRETYRYDEFG